VEWSEWEILGVLNILLILSLGSKQKCESVQRKIEIFYLIFSLKAQANAVHITINIQCPFFAQSTAATIEIFKFIG